MSAISRPADTYDKPGLYQIKISLFRPGCMEQVIEDTSKSLKRSKPPMDKPTSTLISRPPKPCWSTIAATFPAASPRSIAPSIPRSPSCGARAPICGTTTGKRYIDYHAGFAPYFLGHNFAPVNQAAAAALASGDSLFGAGPSIAEGRLAELICQQCTGGGESDLSQHRQRSHLAGHPHRPRRHRPPAHHRDAGRL